MKSKSFAIPCALFALAFLALVVGAGVASAAVALEVPTSITGNHGTDVTVTLNVTATDANHTGLTWELAPGAEGGITLISQGLTAITVTEGKKSTSIVLRILRHASGSPKVTLRVKDSTNPNLDSELITVNIASSPALTIVKTRELTINQTGTITINNTGNVDFTSGSLTSSDPNIAVSQSTFSLLAGVGSSPITVSIVDLAKLKFGTNPVTLTATAGTTSDTETFTLSKSFCRNGEKGNLSLSNVDINNEGEGDDDEWNFLDNIIIEVEVDNNADVDIDDVQIEIGLFDSAGRNMINDLDFANKDEEKIEVGDINDGDEETATFEFTVPADLDSGNYRLAVKAYSKKSGVGESNICADSSDDLSDTISQSISVDKEDDEGKRIAFDRLELRPTEATCGESVSLSFDAVNIGDEDEDQVKVNIFSKELGVDASQEIKQGLDQGDKRAISLTFTVPQGLPDKTYRLSLDSEYDYRNGIYRESLDEQPALLLKVFGCTVQQPPAQTGQRIVAISASLDSEANAGQEMQVTATLRSLGNTSTTFLITADGYQDWAELQEISDRVLSLEAGESKEVTLTFLVDKDAEGEQSFTIDARAGDKRESREVSVDIGPSSLTKTPQLSELFQGNSLIWIIAIVNIILIVLIIIIAVRIARK